MIQLQTKKIMCEVPSIKKKNTQNLKNDTKENICREFNPLKEVDSLQNDLSYRKSCSIKKETLLIRNILLNQCYK